MEPTASKCRYCTLLHTEAAKLFGATEKEIQEAVHYAKYTVGWSVYAGIVVWIAYRLS